MTIKRHFRIPTQAKKAKESEKFLPDMGAFEVEEHREDIRISKLLESIDGYLKDLDSFVVTSQTDVSSLEYLDWSKNPDKAQDELRSLLILVHETKRRCAHSIIQGYRYRGLEGHLASWWRLAALFSPIEVGQQDIEVVDEKFRSSRYFVSKSRQDVDPPNRSRSFYDACRLVLHAFPFASSLDKRIWAAYCDGFPCTEVCVLVGETLQYTESRVKHFTEIAKSYEEGLGMIGEYIAGG